MHCHEMFEQAAAPSWGAGYYYHGAPVLRTVGDPVERAVRRLAASSAVVIFSWSSCCMCHAVKKLFCGLGVGPAVYEVDLDPRGKEIERALRRIVSNYNYSNNNHDGVPVPVPVPVPVVFIGGKLIGGMDRVMGSHINGSLVPLLKEAGALWL